MELLTSLPPDLAGLADPSVREPALLKRPPDAGGSAPTTFALLLGLLTIPVPSGEAWPPAGKELPVLPLDPEADSDAAGGLAPSALSVLGLAVLTDAVLQARLRAGDALPSAPPSAAPVSLPLPQADAAIVPPTVPSSEPTPAALAPQTLGDFDPLAALAAADVQTTPPEGAEPQAATATARITPAPAWLESFTAHERRLQRPLAAMPSESRAAAGPPPTATAPLLVLPQNGAAVAETPWAAHGVAPRLELPNDLVAVATAVESASSVSADFLPASGHGPATSSAAAPTATAPQAPVDLRSPSWHEAFASRVQYLVDTHVGEARIKLNPPELGAVDVKISLVDDKTYVQLTTATAAARDELAQSLPRLRELFTVSGLELGGASVHNGREGQPGAHGYGAGGAAARPEPLCSFAADLGDAPAPPPRRSLGRIDVFA
jgi:flagellar hook-length control protein FliK